jgi:hypothetical protein
LSPIRAITSGGGPMKTTSFSAHARANAAFSARKPQPGWTPSHSVVFAAAISDGIWR